MTGTYRGKRLLDLLLLVVFAGPALLLGLICALVILFEDGRPVLIKQTRTGRHGKPFTLLKLRTMVRHTPPESEIPDFALITRTGRTLRRLSIDELPQLVNVARGEMSIVGPRPTFLHRTDRYSAAERQRLTALPGLTGLAQTSGRNSLGWDERTNLDLAYVRRQNLRLDVAILLKSVRVVATGEGVTGHPAEAVSHMRDSSGARDAESLSV